MNFPRINRQPIRTIGMPKISGGVNLRDAATLVNDNQLTECKNVWYKDNALKTRPGLYTNSNMTFTIALKDEVCEGKPTDIYMTKNGQLYRLFQYSVAGKLIGIIDNSVTEFIKWTGVFWVGQSDVIELPRIDQPISFITKYKNKLYAFTTNFRIYTIEINSEYTRSKWTLLTEEDYYVPLIATNCVGGSMDGNFPVTEKPNGVMVEGYNILSTYYKLIYSTVNREKLDITDENSRHTMQYALMHDVSLCQDKKLTVKITNKAGTTYTHCVTIKNKEPFVEGGAPIPSDDGMRLRVYNNRIEFVSADSGELMWVAAGDYVENNMEIVAPSPRNPNETTEACCKVFNMRENIWFGGDALGISGGTRLFLGSNDIEENKSLVVWSALNDLTYFPENCYAYVGDSTQKVTAFGRQNDSLIIFKERETFYTQYTRNADITADALIGQSIVDYAAANVYFPMIQLHSTIGCDCPNTIQLCRNFLVWADSNGNVYTLRNQNQYSERNIYRIADMVKSGLCSEDLSNSYSADYDGHYFLFTNGSIYVMNYESYGYVYASSYNKTEDAQLMIPWWRWEIPLEDAVFSRAPKRLVKGGFVIGNKLFCMLYNSDGAISNFYACRFTDYQSYDMDDRGNEMPIDCCLTTKIFDFGSPHTTKNVPLVNINFGNNNGSPISVSFVTDNGIEDGETVVISEKEVDERSSEFIHNRQFRPCTRLVNRFGVKLECKGKMHVDGISLNYKILGGSR